MHYLVPPHYHFCTKHLLLLPFCQLNSPHFQQPVEIVFIHFLTRLVRRAVVQSSFSDPRPVAAVEKERVRVGEDHSVALVGQGLDLRVVYVGAVAPYLGQNSPNIYQDFVTCVNYF
jgi:hypothetical protein